MMDTLKRRNPIPDDPASLLWHVLTIDPQRQLKAERSIDDEAGVVTVCPVRWRKAFVRPKNTNPDARRRAKAAPPVARAELSGYLIVGIDRSTIIPWDLIQKVDGVRGVMCRMGDPAVVPARMVKPMLDLPDQWTPPSDKPDTPMFTPAKVGERLSPIRGYLHGSSVTVAEVRSDRVRVERGDGQHPPLWIPRSDLRDAQPVGFTRGDVVKIVDGPFKSFPFVVSDIEAKGITGTTTVLGKTVTLTLAPEQIERAA